MADKTENFGDPMYATREGLFSCLEDYSLQELENAIYDKMKIPRPEDCIDIDSGDGF